jgi:anaphase-promoting complex subunit 1
MDLTKIPLGVAAPIYEAARTCQLSPPRNWSPAAYHAIGRNDLAVVPHKGTNMLFNDGYRAPKDYNVSGPSL